MSLICARTGSSPWEVSTTKSARLRFSASGICRARMELSLSSSMVPRASTRSRCSSGRRRHDDHRIDALLAAGLEQQRHIDHRRPARRRPPHRQRISGATRRAWDARSARAASWPRDRAPRARTAWRGRPCRPTWCRGRRLRSPAPLRPRRVGARSHRRRRRARPPPRTALRWWISPFRSSRSAPGSAFAMVRASQREQMLATQKAEQGQERQAQNGEVIALDPLEQMHAQAFELIGADALGHGFPRFVQIGRDVGFAQLTASSSARPRPSRTRSCRRARPQWPSAARGSVRTARGFARPPLPGRRLVEETIAQRQGLVGADDIMSGLALPRPIAPSPARAGPRSRPAPRRFESCCIARSSISAGTASNCKPGIGQQHFPRAALRSQDQRLRSAPERHAIPRTGAAAGRRRVSGSPQRSPRSSAGSRRAAASRISRRGAWHRRPRRSPTGGRYILRCSGRRRC